MVKTTGIPDESVEAHQKTETMNTNVVEVVDKSARCSRARKFYTSVRASRN